MFYLIATILLNTVLSVFFKLFPRYRINTFQAIIANYWVCVITGSLFTGVMPFTVVNVHQTWFPWALITGVGFICIFNLIGYCTRVDGITTTTVANKLSLGIPVLLSLVLYHEHAGTGKIIGILLAFPAVYLTTRVKEEGHNKMQSIFWPVVLFIGSGLLDALTKYVQFNFLSASTAQEQAIYTVYCFAAAGTIGTVIIAVLVIMGKMKLQGRNIIAGICLGIPNYFSIYYLIRLFDSNFLQSSASIPVLNIGILVSSSLAAIMLFKEKVNVQRVIGLILSIGAILLIAYGDIHG